MNEEDLRIARWRCIHKHRIPHELIDDFLHDAIVLALEKDEGSIDEFKMGNWLALVAYRRFLDDKYRLRTRKTKQWPTYISKDGELCEVEFNDRTPTPDQIAEERDDRLHLEQVVHEWIESFRPRKLSGTLHLLARVGSKTAIANSEGVTKQAVFARLDPKTVRGLTSPVEQTEP